VGGVADVALAEVNVTLGQDLQALALQSVRGRLGAKVLANGFDFSTQGLQFDTRDGLHWPGGNVSVMYLGAEGKIAAHGEFKADKLDLAALAQIADRLPMEATVRTQLQAYAPRGLVERVQASWQGPISAPTQYAAKGLVSQLQIQGVGQAPGFSGATVDFDLTPAGGKARISVANGAVDLPAFFEEPVIPVAQLSTEAKWQIKGEQIAVQLANLKFSNADAQGEAQIKWETSDPAKSNGRSRFPGVLDLQATLSRADGTRVFRYLPTVLAKPVRDYVRDALLAGSASAVRFKVRGDLHDMPFTDPRLGEFRVSADVQNATLAYVPRSLQTAEALPWPALTQLTGELVIDRAQLQVKAARARMGNGLQVSPLEAVIPDLNKSTVTVNAEVRGALSESLAIVNNSPLALMTDKALGQAVASGPALVKLKLVLPIAEIAKSQVQGSVTLNNNDLHIVPAAPRMTRARGIVNFTETGFSLAGTQARLLGGDARLEGGSTALTGNGARDAVPIVIRVSGNASAEGLRQAKELNLVARLAQNASGNAAYSAVLGFRRGEPELLVTSNLQGMALNLPAPLNKSAEAALPLRLETALVRESLQPGPGGAVRLQDQITVELGRAATVVYVRDISGPEPRVLRGSLSAGLSPQESAPLPAQGVAANLNLSALELDLWHAAMAQITGTSPAEPASSSYLPTSLAVRAQTLTFGGRQLHNVVVGGTREGLLWKGNLNATELNGYLEYRQPSDAGAGRVFARLARLTIAPGAAREVEALLEEQPASIPALDIVVEDFELRGKHLGRVEIEAINRGAGSVARDGGVREWRLNKFNLITPEAALTASGNWAAVGTPVQRGAPERRRTVLNFKLDIHDGGELLSRFGMKDVVRRGLGKMEGQVAWIGSPLSLDYPSMTGAFTVNVETGQFLKADPGIAKLFGVLSLQALPRRLTLDFRDVFSEGFAFDFFRGDVTIEQGIAKTNNLQMKGINAAVLMEGRADLARETQDLKVVVVPEINAGTASLIATVINPAVGLGTFLAQFFLRRPLIEAATQEFHIDGPWADPKITKVVRNTTPANSPKTGATGSTPP
jgi:uncharacterized protein (TIGR02099 family)